MAADETKIDPDTQDPEVPAPSSTGMWVGIIITAITLAVTVWYLIERAERPLIGKPDEVPGTTAELLLRSTIADIGQFVSGVAGTLAFLWIILTYRQQSLQLELQRRELQLQRNELKLSREQLKRMADEAAHQVEELRLTRDAAARDAFIRAYDLYGRQLAHEAALLYKETMRGVGGLSTAYSGAWEEYQRGNVRVFFVRLLLLLEPRDSDKHDVEKQQQREQRFLEAQVVTKYKHMFRYSDVARDVMKHASDIDGSMVALCRRTEWWELSERLERLIRLRDISRPVDMR